MIPEAFLYITEQHIPLRYVTQMEGHGRNIFIPFRWCARHPLAVTAFSFSLSLSLSPSLSLSLSLFLTLALLEHLYFIKLKVPHPGLLCTEITFVVITAVS